MKLSHLLLVPALMLCISICAQNNTPKTVTETPLKEYRKNVGKVVKTYKVADQTDNSKLYSAPQNKANCYFVISKSDFRLYVYEKVGNGLELRAHYPVCYGKNTGQKTRQGDAKTPESVGNTPFTIAQIQNASGWGHDFKDGRGYLKQAYGQWFMRLKLKGTPVDGNNSIGIHGSTNNAESVPGRDSEGCIRLRDADIIQLRNTFALVGTKVFVRSNTQGKTAAEEEAVKKLGDSYVAPKPGNSLFK